MTPLIRVRGLHYTYPDGNRALCGLDFDLWPRETVALLGPNGSGKSTFSLHLTGLLEGSGAVEIGGERRTRTNAAELRRKVGLLFQNPEDQLFMPTVLEDVCFGPLNHGKSHDEAREMARGWLREVGMDHAADRLPQQLSAGEKRRVAIAGVLALEPEVLVLDEPTTYLDPPGQRDLIGLLARLPQAKIIVTHDVPFARALATRAVFFDRGSIVAEGTVNALVEQFDWYSG